MVDTMERNLKFGNWIIEIYRNKNKNCIIRFTKDNDIIAFAEDNWAILTESD